LGEKIKALTFALPNKKWDKSKAKKIFESLETTARIFGFTKGNVSANIN
jgi:FKBP-type peptidyl-prolyl cis-trans isomerase (trigger factor)